MFKYFKKKNTTKNLHSSMFNPRKSASLEKSPRGVRAKSASVESALCPRESGFAVLFAVLLSSFLITLGLSIFTISLKEIQIATSVRDSQIAYYIADSARECALHWDVKEGVFPGCTDSVCTTFPDADGNEITAISPFSVSISCNNVPFTMSFFKNGSTYSTIATDFFRASSTSLSMPISDISIIKVFDDINQKIVTTMEAYGHNTGIIGRRIERGIKTVHN